MSSIGGRRKKRVTRRHAGAGWLSSINDFLKKSKIVSTLGSALGSVGVPYASSIGSAAGKLGYGRRRKVGRPKKRRVGGSTMVAF